ncbi:MAG: hypothetical protein KF724_05530 [Phycisphaeraceae bacterium]|nr:hypothetical protein [Phycisphaeraceae bacterium]
MVSLLSVALVAFAVPAAVVPPATSPPPSPAEVERELKAIVDSSGGRATLSSIGRSLEGRELHLLTISRDPALALEQPSLLVVAGLDGTRGATTSVALRMAKLLADMAAVEASSATDAGEGGQAAAMSGEIDGVTFHFIVSANPDAAVRQAALPSARGALNARPVDEDRDGRMNEDGPVDLNSDGVITIMRQLDPKPGVAVPTLMADPADPRLLRAPNRARGEVARYAIWVEGLDQDGDGRIAEDGPGGVDPDRNFPHRWQEFEPTAGVAPLSEPESWALAQFVLEHPRIFAIHVLGRHDTVVQPPDGRGRDVSGRLPIVLEEADVPLWNELAKLYRDTTGQSRAQGADMAGSFALWAMVHRGIPTFATTMWGRPDLPERASPERGAGDGAAPAATAPPESEIAAPATPTPGAAAAEAPRPAARPRGRSAPPARAPARPVEPTPAGAVEAEGADWLKYSDSQRDGAGFVEWTPFDHPTLGPVEIGGFVPGFRENPPADQFDEIASKQRDWLVRLASMRPQIEVRGPEVRTLAPRLIQVDLGLKQVGRLPLTLTPGKSAGMARAVVTRLSTPLDRVKSGRRVDVRRGFDPGEFIEAQWIVDTSSGEPFEITIAHPVFGEWVSTVRDGAASAPAHRAGTFHAEAPIGNESGDLLAPPLPDTSESRALAAKPDGTRPPLPRPAWNRYYTQDEVDEMLRAFAAARPDLARLESLGDSVEGRPVWLLTVTNFATGEAETKPAMYVDGSIHANEIQATETVLYSIWYLLENYGRLAPITDFLDRGAFYFVPVVAPDSRAAWFRDPNTPHSHRTGRQPTDDDGDGLVDEDGPVDLDGDGSIGQMWRRDPFGTHRRNPRDPRILEPVPTEPRADGTREYGDWSFAGPEGIDQDGDGRIGEDPPGVYDMNRNFPSDWQPSGVQSGAGPWPLFYPETRAIGRLLISRSNIAAGQAFHNMGGMILRGPGAPYREGEYPRRDLAVYDAISSAGAEMLPFYRPLVIHSGLYTVHGGLVNWIAEGLGIVSFTNELWTTKRILQTGQDPTPEQMRRWRDRMLFGETFTDWTEMDHPDLGRVLVGGGDKYSSRIPPGFMLEEECHRNFAFVFFHAEQMPLLRWESMESKSLGGDLWEVTVAVANDRLIPTRTARAAEKSIGRPDLLVVDGGPGVEVIASGLVQGREQRTFTPQPQEPARLMVNDGVPSHGSTLMRLIVKGPAGAPLKLNYQAEKARDLEGSLVLGAEPTRTP